MLLGIDEGLCCCWGVVQRLEYMHSAEKGLVCGVDIVDENLTVAVEYVKRVYRHDCPFRSVGGLVERCRFSNARWH